MELFEIKAKIKEIIYQTTNIKPEEIGDDVSFIDELELDSLTMLEIAINVDQEFGLDFPDDALPQLTSVNATTKIVIDRLAEKETAVAVS